MRGKHILVEGIESGPLDVAESERIARRIAAKMRDCYRNATLALLASDTLAAAGIVYVEGIIFWTDQGLLTEHGWLEWPDGRVIDPTALVVYRHTHPRATPPVRYFPGDRYTATALQQLQEQGNGTLTLPLMQLVHGWHSLAMRRAWYNALVAAKGTQITADELRQLAAQYGITESGRETGPVAEGEEGAER